MKRISVLIAIAFLFAMSGFSQDTNTEKLLSNEQSRTQIFNAIMNDHQLMSEFINAMHGNEHAMMMMQNNFRSNGQDYNMPMHGNSQMMGHNGNMHMQTQGDQTGMMMNYNEMMNRMMTAIKDNPEIMGQMMERMMNLSENDSTMTGYMVNVLKEYPDMINNCINSNTETSNKIKDRKNTASSKVNAMNNMPMQSHMHY